MNTFEFIEVSSWCRLADSANDLYLNHKTYLPLFSDSTVSFSEESLLKNKSMEFISEKHIKFFLETHAGGPVTLNELSDSVVISGAIIAHLKKLQ